MTAPATCEPPPEHRDVEWHWLREQESGREVRWKWRAWDGLYLKPSKWSPALLYIAGWRYVGPARPPKEGE